MTKMVKNVTVIQKTQVQSLDQEYPQDKGMTIHSNIPDWRISWTDYESQIVGKTERLTLSFNISI